MKIYLPLATLLLMACSYDRDNRSNAQPETDSEQKDKVTLVADEKSKKVDVLVDGKLFTSYIYPNTIKKPVLWPVITAGGNEVTRQFPFKTKEGERVDHPHHVGVWLNYGDVNGLDFWNHSEAISADRAPKYGTIYHQNVEKMQSGDKGILITSSVWNDHTGKTLLDETTEFTFSTVGTTRLIDRQTTLTARDEDVTFTDNKEGMFAIRVTTELELPRTKALKLSDAQGNVTEVEAPDNSSVTGDYFSSEGLSGGDVWGTRAKYMRLTGQMNGEDISLVIIDHPDNVGYPTYWHARGYGLFAANTLGQKIFSKGENELNFSLKKGQSVTFNYRLAVISGPVPDATLEELTETFQASL